MSTETTNGTTHAGLQAWVDEVAAMLHCDYLMEWDVGRLSGGQRRIIEVGLALVNQPSVVLLDEPTLGLDPATRLSLWQTVKAARRETGAAFLVTTHYIDEVAEHLSNVSVINHGTVVANGSLVRRRQAGRDEGSFTQTRV